MRKARKAALESQSVWEVATDVYTFAEGHIGTMSAAYLWEYFVAPFGFQINSSAWVIRGTMIRTIQDRILP